MFPCFPLYLRLRKPIGSRSLFTPPSLSLFGSDTHTYHERKAFPYKQKELYEIVADVKSYPAFIPYCLGSRVVAPPHDSNGRTIMDAELTVGFLAFKESYVSRVTLTPYESVEAIASTRTPLFKTLSTVWRLQPAPLNSRIFGKKQDLTDDGLTIVTLDLAYAFANPLHASVSSSFFGKVSKLMVKAFEDRCLEIYGPR